MSIFHPFCLHMQTSYRSRRQTPLSINIFSKVEGQIMLANALKVVYVWKRQFVATENHTNITQVIKLMVFSFLIINTIQKEILE